MEMQNNDSKIPWSLITAALEGDLTSEDKLRLDSWLMESPANKTTYERLVQVWTEGMADYPIYLEADETRAWSEMQARLAAGSSTPMFEGRPTATNEVRSTGMPVVRSISWTRWAAAAAVILLVVSGAQFWRMSRNGETQYATTDQPRTVKLADNTLVVMGLHTRMTAAAGKVSLIEGNASFAVQHRQDHPFEVVMDGAKVKDIGTNFTVSKTADSIQVIVTEGTIAFTNTVTGESREVAAGGKIVQMMTEAHRGEIKTTELRFDNARLSEVIAAVQEQYGKKIVLADTSVGKKRLTVHLEGESFDDAVKVICGALNLEYQADGNGYILKNRTTK
jgi:transmembrane sensor